ncbi:MAG: CAP domain-containing protein [Hyphomicrobiaceae bacterium]
MTDLPNLPAAEMAIVQATNDFRRAQGVGRLTRNHTLDTAARAFATYLARSGRFAHEADGRSPADRAKASGYAYCTVAENLALNLDSRGFKTGKLVRDVVEGWKHSKGHRHNMLLPQVTEIGVGVARAPGKDPKFLSVQLFGRPLSLTIRFKITNKSRETVGYRYAGRTYTIKPRMTVTHKSCSAGNIVFEHRGGLLTSASRIANYNARNGASYLIDRKAGGKVGVSEQR